MRRERRRERVVMAAQNSACLNPYCPDRRNAVPGQMGYCNPCGQQVRRRLAKGAYDKGDLIQRGKLLVPAIDVWLDKK